LLESEPLLPRTTFLFHFIYLSKKHPFVHSKKKYQRNTYTMTRVDDGSTKASKSEADEEDDDYPAANSLDLIKDRFLPFRLFFLFSASNFLFFSPSVACCGVGWPGWRGRLWSEMLSKAFPATRLRCVGNAFETRSKMHLKRAFRFCCCSKLRCQGTPFFPIGMNEGKQRDRRGGGIWLALGNWQGVGGWVGGCIRYAHLTLAQISLFFS